MKFTVPAKARRRPLLTLFVLALVTTLVAVPSLFRSGATAVSTGNGLLTRTVSEREDLPNYDIRSDKNAADRIAAFRSSLNRSAAQTADIRDEFARGEAALASRIPTLKVEYNTDIRIPEVISPDVLQGRAFLTGASSAKRSDVLKNFLTQNSELVGVNGNQVRDLKVFSDYTNPDGNLSFVELNQEINGVPVFRGEVKAGFSKSGEMIRVINNLAPGLDYDSLSTDFGDASAAVRFAAANIKHELNAKDVAQNSAASTDLKVVFGQGDWATTAEKMYFPTEPGVAVPAWRVLIWEPVNAFYVIVDAGTGTVLWRKNIGEDQTQAATYQVYANPLAMINSADNPAPLTPGPVSPATGTQGAIIARTNVTRVGNEAPYTFNNTGWITDGANITDGNALEAGIDRDGINGVDATQAGAPNRVFDSTWNPPPGNPAPGDEPLTAQAQRGAVISMFYMMNLYHDELYRLGFTEQARNFQASNFGRGGVEADRVSGEGQDSSGTNNANFNTPADGGRGRMQMYLWTGPTPDYDGTTDAEIIIHEVTHGTSNRLHGNSAGLSTNMSRGMGEGWGDFYGHAMLSQESDPINGIYTIGGYATYLGASGYVANYYDGIRRFPKAVMAFTGGPLNRPHNPLTFADLNAGCVLTDGAFARGPFGVAQCDAVHNAGEIWSSALWEVRAKMITRLGWADGNRKTLQFVTDGMKLAPLGPTFLQERDAILAAAQASAISPESGLDVADVWAGFAVRGMGFSSSVTAIGTPAVVVEAFDLPNLVQTPTFSVSDATGNNNGIPEPGEAVVITVPLSNSTGSAATGVTAQIVGGGSANYGTIANAATVSQPITYTIPSGAGCGSNHSITINVNSSLGATSFVRTFLLGAPVSTATQNFDGVTAPALPAGWTADVVQSGINFVTTTNTPDSAPNAAFALDPATVGGGTNLTSPSFLIPSANAALQFRNRFDTESGWDGGLLEISIAGGAYQEIIAAGGTFLQNGYNGTLGAGANNPLANRNAWNGNSGGYLNTVVRLPAAVAGQNVQFRFRFGADDNTVGTGPNPGWYIDNINVIGTYTCAPVAPAKSRADFDGDGKTDLSVFRPTEGNWYLNRSTSGFTAVGWGLASDLLAPGDYDGDNKTDLAVFRPSTGVWWILRSSDGGVTSATFGVAGDIPVAGDYDGDNKADVAVFRPSTNAWFVLKSTGGTIITPWGAAGDQAVPGDYDGDAKTDIAIYRPGTSEWWIARSTGGVRVDTFGIAGDRAVPADYDGDNKDDIAVFRPSTGTWYALRSSLGYHVLPFGVSTDIPVPGDYDGDGKDDQAVYRNGTWYVNRSTSGLLIGSFGLASDIAIPAEYIP